ncbi:MAG TPA: hypothetical protein VFP43_02900 [Mesorhizobium sp.]|nr:hypothetical protein [Mesorhizobium sp.]
MASMVRSPRILQKFYIYDPNVPDTLGGLRVLDERDDKGNVKEGTRHVLAVGGQVQYWVDQGLMGEKPVGEISSGAKKLLAQVTRGRSEDNDANPGRIPRYDRKIQSGHPGMAGHPAMTSRTKRRKDRKKDKQPKKPEPKAATTSPPPKA